MLTREHIAILDLLGLRRGVVAVTKSDKLDQARLAAVCVEMPRLFDFADRSAASKPADTPVRATVADLIADCDEATAEHLLDLVRVGLKLTGVR